MREGLLRVFKSNVPAEDSVPVCEEEEESVRVRHHPHQGADELELLLISHPSKLDLIGGGRNAFLVAFGRT